MLVVFLSVYPSLCFDISLIHILYLPLPACRPISRSSSPPTVFSLSQSPSMFPCFALTIHISFTLSPLSVSTSACLIILPVPCLCLSPPMPVSISSLFPVSVCLPLCLSHYPSCSLSLSVSPSACLIIFPVPCLCLSWGGYNGTCCVEELYCPRLTTMNCSCEPRHETSDQR